jgi:hypothetical protein
MYRYRDADPSVGFANAEDNFSLVFDKLLFDYFDMGELCFAIGLRRYP